MFCYEEASLDDPFHRGSEVLSIYLSLKSLIMRNKRTNIRKASKNFKVSYELIKLCIK